MSDQQKEPARLYQPKGFTDHPQIMEALEPYMKENNTGDLKYFEGLPASKAADILHLLPAQLIKDQQNGGPPMGKLIEVGLEFGRVWFMGYVVGSERDDERFSLEGFFAPKDIADAVLARLDCDKPDEWSEVDFADQGKVMKAWWD
ncbi:hypothetical protein LCGC14_1778400 [marine sediment metagenome]|uniref:Uncharacterized protein n=1 Tax=marine sediment metagenome TaxID=412755 RepID=A0A0F9JB18_9ZZZZ